MEQNFDLTSDDYFIIRTYRELVRKKKDLRVNLDELQETLKQKYKISFESAEIRTHLSIINDSEVACIVTVGETTMEERLPNSLSIIDLSCSFLDELGVRYKNVKRLPSIHEVMIKYTALGNSEKATDLHPLAHNFHAERTVLVEITYSDKSKEPMTIRTALLKKILKDLRGKGKSDIKPKPAHLI